ncbi:hypothetical protein LINPERPRIM_LOCUS28646 [Linum perenne]
MVSSWEDGRSIPRSCFQHSCWSYYERLTLVYTLLMQTWVSHNPI